MAFILRTSSFLADVSYRREPLNETHDYMFGILKNYHCWRFHGSGVMRPFEMVGLILFCTRMHHESFLRSSMCFRVPNFCSKIPKVYHWSMDSGMHSMCFRGHFAIKRVVGFLYKNSFEKCVTRWSILFICNTFSCWLVLFSFLYIELALVCCKNPDNVHCFGTILPNLKFVFALICAARPVLMQSD